MPIPTPFHPCTAPLCESYEWRSWAGYLAPSVYEPSHEREYFAIRNSAGVIDISPLYKYEVTGPDAERLVDRVMTRDITRCRVGQVMYSPWCDEQGQVIDDGTISRLGSQRFRITAADPNLRWFQDVGFGLDAVVKDVSQDLAALALQGPNSRDILKQVVAGVDFDKLKYFGLAEGTLDGFPLTVTRTGYTGDLGYELWTAPEHAVRMWEILFDRGRAYGILPAGILALDIARVEAGLLLIEADYTSSHHALIEARKSSPDEIGLGWTVDLDGADFIGRRAIAAERKRGAEWQFVGVQVDWNSLEALFREVDLPPSVAGRASRSPVPLYKYGEQIGQITSHTFSPILKSYIGLGTVLMPHARLGDLVDMEFTVEYSRETVSAAIVKTPFYNPPWKRA